MIAEERDELAREQWRTEVEVLNPIDLVFLDETSTPTTLTPRYGRAPRGVRVLGRVPKGRWHNVTMLATITPDGMGPTIVIEGAADRGAFDAFIAQQLVPSLRPGQTVILDNLSVHKSATARTLIEGAPCQVRFLPTYSPDVHPIELAFAKIKQHLRRASARSYDAVCAAAAPALAAITRSDAHAFYRAAGYPLKTRQPLREPL